MRVESNILNKKLELIQWLSTVEDLNVIEKIQDLRNQENKDWWNIISEAEKTAIVQGLKDADEGKLNSHAKARELYEKN